MDHLPGARRGDLEGLKLDRRDFLGAVGATVGVSMSGCDRVAAPNAAVATPRLDAHVHSSSEALAAWLPAQADTTAVARADLDAIGASRAFVLSGAYLFASDFQPAFDPRRGALGELDRVRAENDFSAEQCAGESRLVPFCSLNPKRDYAPEELARCVEDLGVRGLKLHFWNSNMSLRDRAQRRRLHSVLAYAGGRRLPLLVHVLNGEDESFGRDDARHIVDVLTAAGAPPLCLAHLCGAGGYDAQVAELFDAFLELREEGGLASDTLVELSATLKDAAEADADAGSRPPSLLATRAGRERLAHQLQRWGLDTILWGSDNGTDYLRQTRERWPLARADLDRVLANDGRTLVA